MIDVLPFTADRVSVYYALPQPPAGIVVEHFSAFPLNLRAGRGCSEKQNKSRLPQVQLFASSSALMEGFMVALTYAPFFTFFRGHGSILRYNPFRFMGFVYLRCWIIARYSGEHGPVWGRYFVDLIVHAVAGHSSRILAGPPAKAAQGFAMFFFGSLHVAPRSNSRALSVGKPSVFFFLLSFFLLPCALNGREEKTSDSKFLFACRRLAMQRQRCGRVLLREPMLQGS